MQNIQARMQQTEATEQSNISDAKDLYRLKMQQVIENPSSYSQDALRENHLEIKRSIVDGYKQHSTDDDEIRNAKFFKNLAMVGNKLIF